MPTLSKETFQTTIETNIAEKIEADLRGFLKAAQVVVGRRTKGIATRMRNEVRAGLGSRLANAVRHFTKDLPDGAEGTIWSKGKVHHDYEGPGLSNEHVTWDLLVIFQTDEEVHAREHSFLAIPLPSAGRGPRGRAARTSDFPEGYLVAKIHGDRGVLVGRDNPDLPLFVLLPYVFRRRRLNFDTIREAAKADLTVPILAEWARRRPTIALRLVA